MLMHRMFLSQERQRGRVRNYMWHGDALEENGRSGMKSKETDVVEVRVSRRTRCAKGSSVVQDVAFAYI